LKLILAASGALAAYLAWRSLGWPLIHDAPLMHYIAWVIGEGGVPYRDVFDMNLPGVYLIHGAVIGLLGGGDLAWRLFDLGWLAATGALLWAYARPLGAGPAWAGAVLFTLYHLSGGAWRVGQRDFLLCLFLLAGAYGVARSIERRGALGPLVWGGLALGIGMTVKPHAGVFWLGAAALVGWGAWRGGRSPLAAPGTVLAAALVAPALVFGWLGWRGGFGPFVAVFTGYVVPLYSHVGRVPLWQPFDDYRFGWALWGLLAILAVLGLSTPAPGVEARKAVAALGAVSGALHFALQGKGWEYQLYPLAVFLCALAPFALRRLSLAAWERHGHPSMPLRFPVLRRAAALVLFAASAMVLGAKGVDALEEPWIADKARRAHPRPGAAGAAGQHRAGDGRDRRGRPHALELAPAPAHAVHLRLPLLPRHRRRAHRRAAGGIRGGPRGASPCRHRGAARHLEPPRLRAARGLARGRAAARALVQARRRRRRLPDLCQAR
jgi:Dolichyl-phosphate-mannose-protein mannosyltransferase